MKFFSFIAVMFLHSLLMAQKPVTGLVIEESKKGKFVPLSFVNIYWLGTDVGTTTDTNGYFEISTVADARRLVISYVGYKSDTIFVQQPDKLTVVLKQAKALKGVEVVYRKKGTEISYMNTLKVETMGEKELFKAACCNLSESFETNPSIDVAITDAVTGTRQIQMLGLDGKYTQITRESMPDVRGLNAVQGLNYIPGSWIESIQLNKGAGSVVNGYESVTGQINVELKKPWEAEKWFVNGYASNGGRMEGNVVTSHTLGEQFWTGFLLHGNNRPIAVDGNSDGFLDFPKGYQLNAINRWKYNGNRGWEADLGVRGLTEKREGGQQPLQSEWLGKTIPTTLPYNLGWTTNIVDVWAKSGYVFPQAKYKSIGFQGSFMINDQRSYYGLRNYQGENKTGFFNAIYQSIIGSTNHKYRTGLSLLYDDYDERLDSLSVKRTELVPGAFIEYTYSYLEKFAVVGGLRADYHNIYGLFITPRIHVRYEVREGSVLRLSGGRGQRTANVISENAAYLASARTWTIHGNPAITGFGLKPEVAWNFGGNFTEDFRLDYKPGTFSADVYHTVFQNQTVVDLDQNAQEVHIYDLKGRSFATSVQAQVDYELRRRLDVRLAYRWYDVRTNLAGSLRDRPFISKNRAFANVAYETKGGWKFDYTVQWQGQKRIPSTLNNPTEYRQVARSPNMILMNAQITKTWLDRYAAYAGVENLTNVMQPTPIVAADNPFGKYFDSSLVWGPIFGRMVYVGFRLQAKSKATE